LANHKSALKRARQNKVRRLRNKGYRTKVKNSIKEVKASIAERSVDKARESFTNAVSIIQKTADKGIIHKNKAANKCSTVITKLLSENI
jgi:small subunit ribosomal protein S20